MGLWGPVGINGKSDEFMEQLINAAEKAKELELQRSRLEVEKNIVEALIR